MVKRKEEIVTFKVDSSLMEILQNIPNRSEFIRSAILSAMGHLCPLCGGTGYMTPDQRKHWEVFAQHHPLEKCRECDAVYLRCQVDTPKTFNKPQELTPHG